MSEKLFRNQIYSGLLEILKDDKLYYRSVVGKDYCHFTDKGKEALFDYISMMAPYMIEREQKELERLAKQMTWGELSK